MNNEKHETLFLSNSLSFTRKGRADKVPDWEWFWVRKAYDKSKQMMSIEDDLKHKEREEEKGTHYLLKLHKVCFQKTLYKHKTKIFKKHSSNVNINWLRVDA